MNGTNEPADTAPNWIKQYDRIATDSFYKRGTIVFLVGLFLICCAAIYFWRKTIVDVYEGPSLLSVPLLLTLLVSLSVPVLLALIYSAICSYRAETRRALNLVARIDFSFYRFNQCIVCGRALPKRKLDDEEDEEDCPWGNTGHCAFWENLKADIKRYYAPRWASDGEVAVFIFGILHKRIYCDESKCFACGRSIQNNYKERALEHWGLVAFRG